MNHRVIIIDDSEADLLFTRIVLERSGLPLQVQSFERAVDALAFLSAPDAPVVGLILLDINMPGMDGFEFLDAFQKLPPAGHAPAVVVMLTSSPDPQDRARAMGYPAVRGYLTKPVDPPQVRGLMRHLEP